MGLHLPFFPRGISPQGTLGHIRFCFSEPVPGLGGSLGAVSIRVVVYGRYLRMLVTRLKELEFLWCRDQQEENACSSLQGLRALSLRARPRTDPLKY